MMMNLLGGYGSRADETATARGGEVGLGTFVFTEGQRQELERQTIIYKQMMSSNSNSNSDSNSMLPQHLLPHNSHFPFLHPEAGGRRGGKNGNGYTATKAGGGGGDAEPWRCRRTDGKKWRCSRDVVPDQKYCERHSHKGRPSRSRKPVESHSPLLNSSSNATTTTTTTTTSTINPISLRPLSHFSSPFTPYHGNQAPNPSCRYPEWFFKKDVVPAASASPLCHHPQQYAGHDAGGEAPVISFGQRCASGAPPLEENQGCLLPRPFLDAWSLADLHKDAVASDNNISTNTATSTRPASASPFHSILPLTLSVSAGIGSDDSRHMTQGDNDGDHRDAGIQAQGGATSKACQHPLSWMSCWVSSAPGGPLAEALCLGMSGMCDAMTSHSEEQLSPHGLSTSSSVSTNSCSKSDTSAQGFYLG